MSNLLRRMVPFLGLLAGLAVIVPAAAPAGLGPPAFPTYAHDRLYRGILTPTTLSNQGKFDHIFVLGSGLKTVADAAPGDRDYNGGRWEVRLVAFTSISPIQFTNTEQLMAAAEAGQITIGPVVKRFECPLIPINDR